MRISRFFWIILIAFNAQAQGTVHFYSVDFHHPLHQLGQPPTVDAGPGTPSSIVFGEPVVVDSFGDLSGPALLFSGVGYEQIRFVLEKGVSNYFVEFDFETRNLNPSLFAFVVLFDVPYVQTFYLHGDGYIGVPPANSPYLPGWSDNQLHSMRIVVDLDARAWTFQLDDRAPVTGPFSHSGDVLAVRMNLGAWKAFTPDDPNVQIAIKNIVIGTIVPEPSPWHLSLIVLGALFLFPRWSRRLIVPRKRPLISFEV